MSLRWKGERYDTIKAGAIWSGEKVRSCKDKAIESTAIIQNLVFYSLISLKYEHVMKLLSRVIWV